MEAVVAVAAIDAVEVVAAMEAVARQGPQWSSCEAGSAMEQLRGRVRNGAIARQGPQ
jgi:acyl-coenzyme A synthetase/AMP-(fatty) acid ligase